MVNVRIAADLRLSGSVPYAAVDRYGVNVITDATVKWLTHSAVRLSVYLGEDPALESLTPQIIAGWHQWEVDRGVTAVTANSYLRGVRTLYGRLCANGITGHNPAAPVKYFPEPRAKVRAIEKGDYLAMRGYARSPRDLAIIDTLWSTGCRVSGLASMVVDKIDRWQENKGDCYAIYVIGKGARPRYVYAGGDEAASLTAWLDQRPAAHCPALWLASDLPFRGLSTISIAGILAQMKTAAAIPSHHPANAHAFRHAFALRKLEEGKDLAAVSSWLGHASPEFTAAVYCIRSETKLRKLYFSGEK